MKTHAQVRKLVDQIIDYDRKQSLSIYEMGSILAAFKNQRLYELIGCENFKEFVNSELPFSLTIANTYANLFTKLTELKYSKEDSLNLISEHGYSILYAALKNSKKKRSNRAISKWKNEDKARQLNFHMTSDERAMVVELLAEIYPDLSLSDAFIKVIEDYKKSKKR